MGKKGNKMSGNSRNKFLSLKKLHVTSAIALAAVFAPASAAMADVVIGTFTNGSGTFTQEENKTTITVHTTNSIAEFKDYNILDGQEVHYEHDANIGHSKNLSRVTGGNASSIMGRLTSTDVDVYLINPNGVIFGNGSAVDVPNLVVSTSDISNANFQAGNYKFDVKGKAGAKIINNGSITVSEGGLAAFVAPGVENNGIIVARKGKVALAGGDEFTLDMYGDKLVNFAVSNDEKERLVKQSGKIAADGGVVLLTVQDANKVVSNVVNLSGVIEAKSVTVEGDQIILGGENKIRSNGGKVTVIAKSKLVADGKITNKGGFVETSAKEISFGDKLRVETAGGTNKGQWLIDPTNFTVDDSVVATPNHMNNADLALQLASNDITILTGASGLEAGDININNDVIKTSGATHSLTLSAHNDINLKSGVMLGSTNNGLNVILKADHDVNLDGTIQTNGGNLTSTNRTGGNSNAFTNNSAINTNGGNISVKANAIAVYADLTANAGSVDLATGSSGHVDLDAKIISDNIHGDTNTVNIISNKALIQQGIDLVNAGGDVNVNYDTYDEALYIDKDLHLKGTGEARSIIKPTDYSKLKNKFASSYDGNEINVLIVMVQNANVDISNIEVDGSGVQSGYAGNERAVGFGYDNSGGTLDHVNTHDNFDDGLGRGISIFADSNSTKQIVSEGGDGEGDGDGNTDNPEFREVDFPTLYTTVESADVAHDFNVYNSSVTDYQGKGINANGDLLTAHIGKADNGNFVDGKAISSSQQGIEISRGTHGTVNSNFVVGNTSTTSSEILLYKAADGSEVSNNNLTGNSNYGYDDKGDYGINVQDTEAALVKENQVSAHRAGINIENSNNALILGNTAYSNSGSIIVINSTGAKVDNSGNVVTDISKSIVGILISGSDGATIANANIHNNFNGIHIAGSNDATITGNNINNNITNGIVANQSDNLRITGGNKISGNSVGVYLQLVTNSLIDDAVFTGNTNSGVYATDSTNNLHITNSKFTDNGADPFGQRAIFLNYGSNDARISNVSITNSPYGIVVANNSHGLVIDKTSVTGGITGLYVSGTGSDAAFSGTDNSFSGQSNQYIDLKDNAMFGEVIDVSKVKFDGVVAGTSTDAQSFVIEDKINHKMDDNNVGLAMWRDKNLFATLNNRGIQAGIDIASDGWTVNIDKGTFHENLYLDKAVNLLGRGSTKTIVDGGYDTALTIYSNADFDVNGINFVTDTGISEGEEGSDGAPYAILVDGSHFEFGQIDFPGETKSFVPFIIGSIVNGPLNVDFNDILVSGNQLDSGIKFRNATTVDGVEVHDVVLASNAPNGWTFENVSGGDPTDVLSPGDMDFDNTVFNHTYSVADIHLIETIMDGDASGATFVDDGGSQQAREDRVIHNIDSPPLGTIFFAANAAASSSAGANIGNLAADIANRTDLGDEYYHPVSVIGKINDRPSLVAPLAAVFNTALNGKVDISGGGINIAGKSVAQLAGLAPAAGDGTNTGDLNNLEPSSGPGTGAGGFTTAGCTVNYTNNFLADNIGEVTGACQ